MSTRSILAYSKGKSWEGIYCHWDGYPTNRGKQIWEILHRDFIGNAGEIGIANKKDPHNAVKAFIQIYIKGHSGGWSSFPEGCYCHDAGFVMRDGVTSHIEKPKHLKDTWCEWLYVVDPVKLTLTIFSVYKDKWETPVVTVDLMGKEPDWKTIEKSE